MHKHVERISTHKLLRRPLYVPGNPKATEVQCTVFCGGDSQAGNTVAGRDELYDFALSYPRGAPSNTDDVFILLSVAEVLTRAPFVEHNLCSW